MSRPSIVDLLKNNFAEQNAVEKQAEQDQAIIDKNNINSTISDELGFEHSASPNTETNFKPYIAPTPEAAPVQEQTPEQLADQDVAQELSPTGFKAGQVQQESDPGTWTPDYTQMGFVEKTKESLLRGFGKHVVGGTGDMIQMVNLVVPGWEIAEGNMLSRMLQDKGNTFADRHQIFMPEEMRNPEFNLKTFMNPDFWSGQVAEYIPQLVEFIFLSKGVSALAKGGAKSLARKVGKNTAKKYGRTVLKNTSEQVVKGAAEKTVQETGGKALGKLITQSGEASQLALQGAEMLGGGVSMNVLSGALNAAQLVNQMKVLKDDEGNPLYSDEELRSMATGTMSNNLQYLPIDMLSWGLVYAKDSRFLNGTGTKLKKALGYGKTNPKGARMFYDKASQLKYSGKSFLNTSSPILKGIEKTANKLGKPLFEGFEETFQETFEEWAQKKAVSDVTGKPMEYEDYWDFYFSKENEATRAISFALGGLGGGGSAISQSINKNAIEHYRLWDRSENLKRNMSKHGREADMMQQWHISDQMINNKLDGLNITNEEWLETLYNDGVINDEEDYNQQLELAQEIDADFDKANSMNIRGKLAFLQNKQKISFYNNAIEFQSENLNEKISNFKELLTDNPILLEKKIKEATEEHNVLQQVLNSELALATENVQNLISGKEATPSYTEFIKDDSGKTIAVGLTAKQYEEFYNESDEEILKKAREATLQNGKSFIQRLTSKGKEIFKSISEKITVPKEEGNQETTNLSPDEISTIEKEYGVIVENNVARSLDDSEESAQFVSKANNKINQLLSVKQPVKKEEPKVDTKTENSNIPSEIEEALNNSYSSDDVKGNTEKGIKAIKRALSKLDIDISNEKEAKAELIKQAKNASNGNKLKQLYNELNGNEELLGQFLFDQLTENAETEEVETEETEIDDDGEINVKKTVKKVFKKVNKSVNKAVDKVKKEVKKIPVALQIQRAKYTQQNNINAKLRIKLYSSDFDYNPLSKNEMDSYLTSAIGKLTYGPTAINKAIHLNNHLKELYPEQSIQAYPMTNLYNAIGIDGLGYAVLSSILIDEKVWEQEDIYMHEFAHINYQLTSDTPFVQDFMEKAVLTNKPLLTALMNTYSDQVLYLDLESLNVFERGMIDPNAFDANLSRGQYKMLPINKQSKILEEAYVNSIQGNLSKEFNKYFDSKKEPLRQLLVKRMWQAIKGRARKVEKNELDVIKALSAGENVPVGNLKSYILEKFVENIQGKDVSIKGMASKVVEKDANILKQEEVVYNKWLNEVDSNVQRQIKESVDSIENKISPDDNFNNDPEVFKTTADDLEIDKYNKTFENLEERMGDIFINFFQKYYQKLKKKHDKDTKNKDVVFISPFSDSQIKEQFMQLAKNTSSPFGFINILEKSNDPHIIELMAYLSDVYPDTYLSILRSAHLVYHNSEVIPGISHSISSNGNYIMETAFSKVENDIMDNLMVQNLNYEVLETIAPNIISEDPNINSISKLISAYSNASINKRAIIDGGYLVVEGRLMTLKNGIKRLVEKGLFNSNNGEFDFDERTEELVKTIVNTNRQYSSMSVVKGPKGENTSSRIVGNNLTKLVREIKEDLIEGMSKKDFLDKYSYNKNIRTRAIEEIRSNPKNTGAGNLIFSPLLQRWYDNYESTGEIPSILQDLGNRNSINNTAKDYKDSTANEQLINETLAYFDSAAKGRDVYHGSLDVFGDSSRRYLISMPVHTGIIEKGNLTTEGKKHLKALYQIYTSSRVDESSALFPEFIKDNPLISFPEFENAMMDSIKDWTKYFSDNSNSLSKVNMLTSQLGFINEKGNLTAVGKHAVETFAFNRIANSFYMHQTLNPGIPLNSIQKRNKGNISPVIALDKNLRIEMLFVTNEETEKGIQSNDGGQYILEEDAKLIEQAGQGAIGFNKGYKLLAHKTERKNPKFNNKTFQMKGYTSVLTKEMVSRGGTQEKLKPYYDLLIERKQKFLNWFEDEYGTPYNPAFGTQDGFPKYMGIITPISTEKGSLLNKKQLEDLSQFSTIDALNNSEARKEYVKILDGFHYQKKKKPRVVNGQSKLEVVDDFNGFDGSNFGPQQVMDKEYTFTTFSIQAISSILVGASGTDLDNAMRIQDLISKQKQDILKRDVLEPINTPFDNDITSFILKTTNQDKADPYNISAMKDGALPYGPHQRVFAVNQMRKQFIRSGNKLLLPGTYAQTIADTGYIARNNNTGEEEFINGTSELNFYSKSLDGKTIPMEVILPKSEKKSGIRKRQKFYGNNVKSIVEKEIRNKHMKEFGLTSDTLEAFVEQHKMYAKRDGKLVQTGYFIPGEYVMMTRIPHNGPVFMAVAETVAFNQSNASNIIAPSEYKNMIGADDDGDALFVYKQAKNKHGGDNSQYAAWNEAFKLMKEQWLSPRMNSFLTTSLNFEAETNKTINDIREALDIEEEQFVMPYSPKSYKESFNNSVIAKQTIGIAFNAHRIINTIAAFGSKTVTPNSDKNPVRISIDGKAYNDIRDFGSGERSRVHQSSKLTNILLDSTKNNHAAALQLNTDTVGPAMILSNMGFSVKDIGLLFNHPAALDYINKFSDVKNNYIDTGSRKQILQDIANNNLDFDRFSFGNISVSVSKKGNEKEYNSNENSAQITQLMNYLFHVNNDISKLSNLMSGHKKLERNPYALEKQIQEYEQLISNETNNQALEFSEEFQDSPEIQNYLYVAKKWASTSKRLSMVFNPSVKGILDKISKTLTSEELNDKQLAYFSEKIRPVIYSRLIGLNNKPIELVREIFSGSTEGVEQAVRNHMIKLSQIIVEKHPTDPDLSLTALDGSRLWREALNYNSETGSIEIVPEWLSNKAFTEENWNEVRNEFSELPSDLQLKLVYYDLVKHGWDSNQSIYPVFSKGIHDFINKEAIKFQKSAENDLLSENILNEALDVIVNLEMQEDRNHFPKLFLNNQEKVDITPARIAAAIKTNSVFRNKIRKGVPFYVQVMSMDKNNKYNSDEKTFVKINALPQEESKKIRENDIFNRKSRAIARRTNFASSSNKFAENVADLIEFVSPELEFGEVPKEIRLVTIRDFKVNNDLDVKKKDNSEPIKPISNNGQIGMAYKTDFNNFTGQEFLTEMQFHDAMQYKTPISEEKRITLYDKYRKDKAQANRLQPLHFTPEKISEMNDDTLLKYYNNYGKKDVYAYSNIIVPILLEITQRASAEQSKVTGRYENGKDTEFIRSYLQSNNIESNHPATQATARHIETGFKSFMNERKKYIREINKVTEDLYKEKFGLTPTRSKFFNKLKLAFLALLKNRKDVYQKLYGNIIVEEKKNDENRGFVKRFKLKSDKVLLADLKSKKITQAEYNFAKTFRTTVSDLNRFANKKDFNTGGYVPSVGMSRMEAFANRGLLGVITNSRPGDIAVQDVVMKFEGEPMTFKEIEDIYKHEMGNNIKNVKDYILLKRKAEQLLKKGINEDGTDLRTSRVSNLTMLGDGMINKFANDGFKSEDEMLSMDLNKALTDYIHTSLFVNGNSNFEGFTKLQAQVDGLLLHNKMKGFDNQAKFVRNVYKEYFLKGQRLKKDTSTDKVVNALVKGNLLYIMGWKLLALGKGAYVVGNVMAGKYHNIKNVGGKGYLKGEARFWNISNGSFKNRKAVGVLNNMNFMDINLYDEVNLQKASGLDAIFNEIIFMPMQYSENWIQGVHFLGLLTNEQWNKFDDNGNYKEGVEPISNEEIAILENKVKNAHGKGYTPTDQRLVQQYSWGKAMMQFARFIPTMFYDRFSKHDINIYGEEHIGSLRAVGHLVQKVISGEIPPKDIPAYRNQMSPAMKIRFDSGLRGLAMIGLASFVGEAFNVDTANDLTGDANYLFNSEKLEYKLMPSTVRTVKSAISSLAP